MKRIDVVKLAARSGMSFENAAELEKAMPSLIKAFDAIEARTIERCSIAVKSRDTGDMTREDMEVRRCVEAIEALKDE